MTIFFNRFKIFHIYIGRYVFVKFFFFFEFYETTADHRCAYLSSPAGRLSILGQKKMFTVFENFRRKPRRERVKSRLEKKKADFFFKQAELEILGVSHGANLCQKPAGKKKGGLFFQTSRTGNLRRKPRREPLSKTGWKKKVRQTSRTGNLKRKPRRLPLSKTGWKKKRRTFFSNKQNWKS